ncbi:MAG: hypothetical protein ACOYN2_03795 [Patescibacteria group bacterium]
MNFDSHDRIAPNEGVSLKVALTESANFASKNSRELEKFFNTHLVA